MPHEFFAKHPKLQKHFQSTDAFHAHATEIKAALTTFLMETKSSDITFDVVQLISANDQLAPHSKNNKYALQNAMNEMGKLDLELLGIMLTYESYEAAQNDLKNTDSEFYKKLWPIALKIENKARLKKNDPETTLGKLKGLGSVNTHLTTMIDNNYKDYFNAKAKLTATEQANIIHLAKMVLSAQKNLKNITLFGDLITKRCNGNKPFRKLMDNQRLNADEINTLHDTLGGIKRIPTFDDYLKSLEKKPIDKDNTNITYLYAQFIQWLIAHHPDEVPVHHLLYSIRVISMYVTHVLTGKAYNSTDIDIQYMRNQAYFDGEVITYINTRDLAKHTRMSNEAFIGLLLLGGLSAALIGSGFLPDFNTSVAITLWAIGAAFGVAFSALGVTSLVKRQDSAALDTAVNNINCILFKSPDLDEKKAIQATLSATTNTLILSRGVFDSQGTFVNALKDYTPYEVNLRKICPSLK